MVDRGGLENRCSAPRDRGFESPSLRKAKTNHTPEAGGFCFYEETGGACSDRDLNKNKIPRKAGFVLALPGTSKVIMSEANNPSPFGFAGNLKRDHERSE